MDAEEIQTDRKGQVEVYSNSMFASVWVKVEKADDEYNISDRETEDIGYKEERIQRKDKPKRLRRKGETLSCETCNYSTSYKNSLVLHMLRHSTTKPFACELCSYTTKYPTALQRHRILKHQSKEGDKEDPTIPFPQHKCDQCDFRTHFKWNLKAHKRKHVAEKQFKCLECSYETAYRHNFLKHSRQHSKIFYKCDKCAFVTKYEGHIYRHMTKIHKGLMDKGHSCNFCDFSTIVKWRLNIHLQRSKLTEVWKCGRCSFETMYRCESKQHKKNHDETNERKINADNFESLHYPASEFDFSINQQAELPDEPKPSVESSRDITYTDDHQKSNHYTVDPNCINWNNIQVRESEDRERPFQCYMCSYTSKFKAAVQRHFQRQHTEKLSRPFKCSNCDFSTKTKDQISLHNKRSQSSERLFCSSCKFTTLFKCQLVMHRKSHYECKCKICDYTCKSKYDLEKHFSIQHLGKFIKCQYCDYKTARKDSLVSHEATHTGDKPLKCPQCDYKTVRNCFLLKHIKRNHSSDQNNPVEVYSIKSLQVPIVSLSNEERNLVYGSSESSGDNSNH